MMSEERDFIKTITLLMRLTHDGKIHWSKDLDEQNADLSKLPGPFIYASEHKGLIFRLEEQPAPLSLSDALSGQSNALSVGHLFHQPTYRLVIIDREDSTEIISPPMKAVHDLVAVIENNPPDRKKLNDINRRLAES